MLVLTLVASGCSGEPEGPGVLAVQADMEEHLRAVADAVTNKNFDVPPASDSVDDLSPCGGIEGASWGPVQGSYDIDVRTDADAEALVRDIADHLTGTSLDVELPSAARPRRFSVQGNGWVATVEARPDHDQLWISGETDCLDNPEE